MPLRHTNYYTLTTQYTELIHDLSYQLLTDRVRQHMQTFLIIALMATRTGLRRAMVLIGVAIEEKF